MTRVEPHADMLALAMRIAADTCGLTGANHVAVMNGEFDSARQVKCALAALIECSELAAKYIGKHYDSGDRDTHYERQITRELRAFDHLKGPAHG